MNETISSLLMAYIAIAVFNHFVEGPFRDPASLNKPSTAPLAEGSRVGDMPLIAAHWGVVAGGVACVLRWILIDRTTIGFAARIAGDNVRAARINLGLEGTLVFGAMRGYAIAYETGSPFIGVLAAALAGACFGLLHGWICKFKGVNDTAVGIAMMLFGMGPAFFFGKPYIQPQAPDLPAIPFGFWSGIPQVQAALLNW